MAFTEDYLKAQVRQQGYLDIMMHTPDKRFSIDNITSTDLLNCADPSTMSDILNYPGDIALATVEENLWILNNNFQNIRENSTVVGYISDSVSDENGEFEHNPILKFDVDGDSYEGLDKPKLSILLNSTVPTAYPKQIILRTYAEHDVLVNTYTKDLEWDEDSGEVDDMNEPIIVHKVLDTLPTVEFSEITMTADEPTNQEWVCRMEIEFVNTHTPHRRIRASLVVFRYFNTS